jgi:RNA polymerase sigma factor (TIGR02999 family)
LSEPSPNQVTELLLKRKCGDQDSLHVLLPLVYIESRRQAQHHLRGERSDHSLQSTALVHEASLRLVKPISMRFQRRGHFFALASLLMREIFVDQARHRRAAKRDGDDDEAELAGSQGVDLLALDVPRNELAKLTPASAIPWK